MDGKQQEEEENKGGKEIGRRSSECPSIKPVMKKNSWSLNIEQGDLSE